ncbi:uncharacterized protein SPAPADRAFT_52938 [Spathaspora passalidarum NRRL Y-27907]|uniref:ER membrane protein complex subunit 3 n=1 Tax=Spathaspora passalidarum (strain NRRL Y-27907 / 11-Y1) TaxID=619300 RepID=G3AV34_SPAPN|nr:uncharacterized protein SPAPADRAFT_52938 [Spathaspora passalidarum NRRL Y-27907]EGW30108.1 hypothetical protein SPAPADRAFT_52938 [Spathaspora passalidarum NRRL Y-27907]
MTTSDLVLDPQLKYWVLLPISIAMVLVGLIRNNITTLLQPSPKLQPYKQERERHFLDRAKSFTAHNHILTPEEFATRKQYLLAKLTSNDFLAVSPEEATTKQQDPLAQLTDPKNNEMMMNMALSSILNYIPQTVIMTWVNTFFSGFIIMKLPFPLTDGFKSMLQNGIATPDLNVSYVSAISWYFVNLLGLRPVYSLLACQEEADSIQQQQQQQQPMNIAGPGAPKMDKVFKAEAENIQILTHESIYTGVLQRVLERNGL